MEGFSLHYFKGTGSRGSRLSNAPWASLDDNGEDSCPVTVFLRNIARAPTIYCNMEFNTKKISEFGVKVLKWQVLSSI